MINTADIRNLLLTPRRARREFPDMEAFMAAQLVGNSVKLADGTAILVTSVMDAGFNGLAVTGRDTNGAIRTGHYR